MIDNVDPSILTSSTYIRLFRKLVPILTSPQSYVLNFGNAFESTGEAGVVESTAFTYNNQSGMFLQDDGKGNLNIVTAPSLNTNLPGTTGFGLVNNVTVVSTIGTVDYVNGIVQINNFNPSAFNGSEIRIYTRLDNQNPMVNNNVILEISSDEIVTAVTAVRA